MKNKMKIEEQVASIELSKELKVIGVKQDSLFSWIEYEGKVSHVELTKFAKNRYGGIGYKETALYAAFTVAELGEMLPGRIKTDYGSWNYLHTTKLENTNEWLIAYFNDELKGSSEADARAKMLLYLIKEKIIKVGEVGK